MVNRRGWLRIMESLVAIMIISSIILITINKQNSQTSLDDYVYDIQEELLRDVLRNESLYNYGLEGNETAIKEYLDNTNNVKINHSVKICEINNVDCKIEVDIGEKNIFSQSIILSANNSLYSPKRIKLFSWI